MAKVANVLIGKSSGSVGGTTFSSWKGINVLKAKPTVVANPQTDKQTAQRAAFSYLVALYRTIAAVVLLGFKEMAVKKSQFNAFQSANLKGAFDLSAPPAATIIPESVMISKGTIAITEIAELTADDNEKELSFSFSDQANLPGQSLTDIPILVVFNETKATWVAAVIDATRAAGGVVYDYPVNWEVDDTLHIYVGFVNADGSKASDSVYATTDIIIP